MAMINIDDKLYLKIVQVQESDEVLFPSIKNTVERMLLYSLKDERFASHMREKQE